jgi:hypothetical protein
MDWTVRPKLEDYPNSAAWADANIDFFIRGLAQIKGLRSQLDDQFIELKNPTIEQARNYKKIDHQCATAIGIVCSCMERFERMKRLSEKPE